VKRWEKKGSQRGLGRETSTGIGSFAERYYVNPSESMGGEVGIGKIFAQIRRERIQLHDFDEGGEKMTTKWENAIPKKGKV